MWTLATTKRFDKELSRLDRKIQQRVKNYLEEVCALEEPRARGKALTGPLAGLWRYRVADYRVEVEISDSELVVVAIHVGHRSAVYR
ncbi:MAG: type II toxin-antitoxin system RelE family toxin [Ancrocorticia sp.]|uniref:type II toxin-antitoxin system RelE family toxin n=1 Tax=Ancrocorticia sp. TaxID=2593684 RepID=UPI003F8F7F42